MEDSHEKLSPADVGVGKAHSSELEKIDSVQGTYHNALETVPTEERLPTSQMPQAPDPSPFVIGPLGK